MAALVLSGRLVTGGTPPTAPPTVAPPGQPVLAGVTLGGHRLPVLVAPGRPGWNLVHVGADRAAVGTSAARLTPATARPGTAHVWAPVWLAPGRNSVLISHAGAVAALPIDAGPGTAGEAEDAGSTAEARGAGVDSAPDLRGPDGPECASLALGRAVAGVRAALRACPADGLAPADAASLRAIVLFVAARAVPAVGLVDDASARGRQAADAVRVAAARAGVRVEAPGAGKPLIVVSGWTSAAATIADVSAGKLAAQGTYLAPWLLTAPLLRPPAGQVIALRFDPGQAAPLRYVAALDAAFPGEPATAAGFAGWSRSTAEPATARLYAASLVFVPGNPVGPGPPARANQAVATAGGHGSHGAARWLPDGTVTAVSGPLSGAA
jgi:hypothetical protein